MTADSSNGIPASTVTQPSATAKLYDLHHVQGLKQAALAYGGDVSAFEKAFAAHAANIFYERLVSAYAHKHWGMQMRKEAFFSSEKWMPQVTLVGDQILLSLPLENIGIIGTLFGKPAKAEALIATMQEALTKREGVALASEDGAGGMRKLVLRAGSVTELAEGFAQMMDVMAEQARVAPREREEMVFYPGKPVGPAPWRTR